MGKLTDDVLKYREGRVFVYFIPKGETVNSDNYCELLELWRQKSRPKNIVHFKKCDFTSGQNSTSCDQLIKQCFATLVSNFWLPTVQS